VKRAEAVDRLRSRGEPTVPFSLAMEAATNPFVRAGSAAELASRRAAKDAFRG
jgi:hydroxyacylglutathione hydrolase